MSILQDILNWSQGLPAWQSDAIARLFAKQALSTEDLEDLATSFIRRFAASYGMPARRLAPSALAQLQMYAWPGNVRELQNMMERAVILCRSEEIGTELLALGRADSGNNEAIPGSAMSLEALERMHIERVLATSDNLDVAAKTLGIDASTLYRKRKAFKL